MPVIPKEGSDLANQFTQANKDAGLPTNKVPKGDDVKATVEDHKANLGPVMGQDLGEPASKEELKKRSEELNK